MAADALLSTLCLKGGAEGGSDHILDCMIRTPQDHSPETLVTEAIPSSYRNGFHVTD